VNFYGRGNYENVDGNLDSIKLIIHNFQGKNDLDAYLEWEKSEIDSHWINRLRIDLVGLECDW